MLPRKYFTKNLNRFCELIKEGKRISEQKEIIPGREETRQHKLYGGPRGIAIPDTYKINCNDYEKWKINCTSLLSQVIPDAHPHQKQIKRFSIFPCSLKNLEQGISILEAIKEDFENGFLEDLWFQIEVEIAVDYMGQAERLLAKGHSGKYAHVPAAMLSGAVLEKELRTLCTKQNPPIPTTHEKGYPLTLNPLINELKKAGTFNEVKAKELRLYADIRNSAAHGKFEEFDRSQVELMIKGIKDFLATYMT